MAHHGGGGGGALTVDTDLQKQFSPVRNRREHGPGLSVCLYGLSLCDPACLLGVWACHTTSMTGHAKNVLAGCSLRPVCNYTDLAGISLPTQHFRAFFPTTLRLSQPILES